jgi:hypothetical protein
LTHNLAALRSGLSLVARATGDAWAETSFLRNDVTSHRQGRALDIAPRSGELWLRRQKKAGIPFYEPVTLYWLAGRIRPYETALRSLGVGRILVEADHLHLELGDPEAELLQVYAPGVCHELVCTNKLADRPFSVRSLSPMMTSDVKAAISRGGVQLFGDPNDSQIIRAYLQREFGGYESGGMGRAELGGGRAELGGDIPDIKNPDMSPPPENAPASIAGLPFIRLINCNLTKPPIPPRSRAPKWQLAQALGRAMLKPCDVLQEQTTFVGPGAAVARIALPLPAPGQRSLNYITVVRCEFGFSQLTSAAGTPTKFDVYSNFVGGADPAVGVPLDASGDQFNTGTFNVTPQKANDTFVVQIVVYQIVNSMPMPFVYELESDNQRRSAGPIQCQLNLRVQAAPVNTNATLTTITPLHGGWATMLEELGLPLK